MLTCLLTWVNLKINLQSDVLFFHDHMLIFYNITVFFFITNSIISLLIFQLSSNYIDGKYSIIFCFLKIYKLHVQPIAYRKAHFWFLNVQKGILLDEQKSPSEFSFTTDNILNTLLLQVPPTMRFVIDGEMPNYLLAKDLILNVGDGFLSCFSLESNAADQNMWHEYIIHFNYFFSLTWWCCHVQTLTTNIQIIGEISMSGATYKTMEFVGTSIETLTVCIHRFSFSLC